MQSILISLCGSRWRSSKMPYIHHCACEIWMGMPHINSSSIVLLYWLCPYRRHANRLHEFIQQLNQCWHIVSRMMGNASQCMIFCLKYHQYTQSWNKCLYNEKHCSHGSMIEGGNGNKRKGCFCHFCLHWTVSWFLNQHKIYWFCNNIFSIYRIHVLHFPCRKSMVWKSFIVLPCVANEKSYKLALVASSIPIETFTVSYLSRDNIFL